MKFLKKLLNLSGPILIAVFVILQLTVFKMMIVDYLICLLFIFLSQVLMIFDSFQRHKEQFNCWSKLLDETNDLSLKTIKKLVETIGKHKKDADYYKKKCIRVENELRALRASVNLAPDKKK